MSSSNEPFLLLSYSVKYSSVVSIIDTVAAMCSQRRIVQSLKQHLFVVPIFIWKQREQMIHELDWIFARLPCSSSLFWGGGVSFVRRKVRVILLGRNGTIPVVKNPCQVVYDKTTNANDRESSFRHHHYYYYYSPIHSFI